jgi:hypothetical protein
MPETFFRRDDESPSEYAERVERMEQAAAWYFNNATKPQKGAHTQAINDLRGLFGPKYERAREAASAAWKASTAEAAALYEETFAELMTAGEVSEALSYKWDELAVADAMLEAAE